MVDVILLRPAEVEVVMEAKRIVEEAREGWPSGGE